MMTHTRSILAHSCFLDSLKEDIMKKDKEISKKFPTNIGKGKKCCGKGKAGKQFYESENISSSATVRDNLCFVTWSHVKFPSKQSMSKKFLKDNSTDKIVNNTSSVKYIREIPNADNNEITSDNSLLKYAREVSIVDDNEIVSDTSSIKNLTEDSSPINSSHIKFSPRQPATNKILKDCYTKGTVNDTYLLKYKKSTSTVDDYEISSDNSLIKHVTEFSNAENNKIVSDTSSIESISGGLSADDNEIVNDTFSVESIRGGLSADDNEIIRDTFSVESIIRGLSADDYEIVSDTFSVESIRGGLSADDNEIISDSFLFENIRGGLCADDNEVISSNCSVKSIGESLKGENRDIDDTPKRIYLKQLDDRREAKRIPIRMANLPRKLYTRDKKEVRITREDIQIVEPNSDDETFDINKFLRKTRRKLNFSLDDIDEKDSETSTCITEDSNVMNELREVRDFEKSMVTENNKNSKQKSKAVENFLSGISETNDLEKSTVTENNKNSKHKSLTLENLLNGLSDLEKSTVAKNKNLNQDSKALENPEQKFFFEGYIDKLKGIASKPPMTKRAKAFEEKTYPKVYFDFDDYCSKIFNLKEKFNEKKNENNKQD